MSKITISLVGGQPFPVYAQALDSKPDILLLLHSNETKRNAERIGRCVKQKLPSTTVQLMPINANDLKMSEASFRGIAKVWVKPEHDIIVNLSGGTKPWSMQVFNILGAAENVRCVFIDQNNTIWDMNTLEHHTFEHTNISLDDKFALYGVLAEQRTGFDEYEESDFETMKNIERLYRADWDALRELTSAIAKDDEMGIKTGYYHNPDNKTSINRLDENLFECRYQEYKTGRMRTVSLDSPHASSLLLNTGWFELKVAHLMAQWYGTRKVWLNTLIKYGSRDKIVNEIDVIVETTSDKLLFVECKTHVHNSTDIDKFNDVIKSYGGLGGKRIFVTYSPMRDLALDKCNALNIPQFSTREILRDDAAIVSFYNKLDLYMGSINAR